jgi:hypothetical protein
MRAPKFVPGATALKAARGATQRAGGKRTESMLDRTHETYHARGTAEIVHLHPPVFGAPGAMNFSGKGHVDYMGVLAGGRCLAFDAKGVTGAATLKVPVELPLSHKHHARSVRDRRRLLDQAALLRSIQKLGGVAAFLCLDVTRARAWVMTDVARIARGEDVKLRERDQDLWPAVAFASPAEIARGAPMIDYLSVWPDL